METKTKTILMAAVVAMAAFSFLMICEDQGKSDAADRTYNATATVGTSVTLGPYTVAGGSPYASGGYTINNTGCNWLGVKSTQLFLSGNTPIVTATFEGTPTATGTFTAAIVVSIAGANTSTTDIIITVVAGGSGGGGSTPPTPVKPVASFTYVLDGLKVNFSDTSTNTPTSWTWAYGDGTSATAKSPTKTYAAAGTYNVTLTATNSAGSNSHTRAVTVNATPGATACTVTYDTDGGTAITAAETTVGATLTLPAATKANKTFTGWYVGASFVGNAGSNYAVTGNATLTAHWADQTTTQYTVTFFHDGRALSSQDVVSGGKATDPGAPAGKGKFTGWATSNGTVYSFATPVTANLNLYAQFDAPSIWDNNLILYALIGLVVVLLIVAIARTIG